ncbi:MAG TPA: metal ABC transporter permease [Nitrospirae bacterium]|nr:high-affinity zinc uptake system membrane protein ZnuB [bacterium BMS3Abin10]GBE37982.1 high-affinity zinc uptake system membrane protein ZnuB [bacterium BMS3Bbin08]HDH51090.1 metal ABC transporter permease [Nitrospirota bacterium]HDK17467.1 metal ABC transporter permease [Nitrospirota bacterium]HDK82305.1 metal ABC transporter permease [Nitrospirota bacterium]
MSTIIDLLSYPFMQRALLAAVMVGILCPFIGNFVVMRKMAFFSSAISHSAFAGIALGALLGIDFSFSSVALSILIALFIAFLAERTTLSHDTIIGIAFSGIIAAGMLIMGFLKGYRAALFSYLFGDILAVNRSDLLLIFAVSAMTIVITLTFLKAFLQITFYRDLAKVEGINVRLFEYLMFLIIALVVTVSLKIVGIILVTSMLIIPAAAAKNLASSMRGLFSLSCAFGVISGVTGLIGSFYLNTASGPTIVLVSIGIFFLTMLRPAKS